MRASVPAYTRLVETLRPHQYHLVFLLWIGGVLLGGTIYSHWYQTSAYNLQLSATRAMDYAAHRAMQHDAPSIFADRRNLFNVLFIKRAWFWNTLAVLLVACTLERGSGGLRGEVAQQVAPRPMRSASDALYTKTFWRWLEATIGWFFFSQWFFGPSLSERVMIASGGQCVVNSMSVDPALCHSHAALTHGAHPELFSQLPEPVQMLGKSHPLYANWHGGHDVSGHTFILVLGMLLVMETLIPYAPYILPQSSALRDSIPRSLYAAQNVFQLPGQRKANLAVLGFCVALLALWSSMLLATSLYFHHPGEKLTGFLSALAVWALMPKETVLA